LFDLIEFDRNKIKFTNFGVSKFSFHQDFIRFKNFQKCRVNGFPSFSLFPHFPISTYFLSQFSSSFLPSTHEFSIFNWKTRVYLEMGKKGKKGKKIGGNGKRSFRF